MATALEVLEVRCRDAEVPREKLEDCVSVLAKTIEKAPNPGDIQGFQVALADALKRRIVMARPPNNYDDNPINKLDGTTWSSVLDMEAFATGEDKYPPREVVWSAMEHVTSQYPVPRDNVGSVDFHSNADGKKYKMFYFPGPGATYPLFLVGAEDRTHIYIPKEPEKLGGRNVEEWGTAILANSKAMKIMGKKGYVETFIKDPEEKVKINKIMTSAIAQKKADKMFFTISTDPSDVSIKSLPKGVGDWHSCEAFDSGYDYNAGPFDDVMQWNGLVIGRLGSPEGKWHGRAVLRWCENDKGKRDIGVEPRYYQKGKEDVNASRRERFVMGEIDKKLRSLGYLDYKWCRTPYHYDGFSDQLGVIGDALEISRSDMQNQGGIFYGPDAAEVIQEDPDYHDFIQDIIEQREAEQEERDNEEYQGEIWSGIYNDLAGVSALSFHENDDFHNMYQFNSVQRWFENNYAPDDIYEGWDWVDHYPNEIVSEEDDDYLTWLDMEDAVADFQNDIGKSEFIEDMWLIRVNNDPKWRFFDLSEDVFRLEEYSDTEPALREALSCRESAMTPEDKEKCIAKALAIISGKEPENIFPFYGFADKEDRPKIDELTDLEMHHICEQANKQVKHGTKLKGLYPGRVTQFPKEIYERCAAIAAKKDEEEEEEEEEKPKEQGMGGGYNQPMYWGTTTATTSGTGWTAYTGTGNQ